MSRPSAQRALRRRERRGCQRPPRVRCRVVGGAVARSVAAAASAPADQLVARPRGEALAGRRLGEHPPGARRGVEGGLAAAPEQHLLACPGRVAAAVRVHLRRGRQPPPGVRRGVVRGGDVLRADHVPGRPEAEAGDDQLLPRPGGRRVRVDPHRRRRHVLPCRRLARLRGLCRAAAADEQEHERASQDQFRCV